MAITTDNEKLSLISYHQPWIPPTIIRNGALTDGDKQHLIWEYPGITWTGGVVGVAIAIFHHYYQLLRRA